MHEEPPIVDLDEILDEQEEAEARATRTQLLLVVAGGVVAIAGILTVLVVTAPGWLQLVRVIAALTTPETATP